MSRQNSIHWNSAHFSSFFKTFTKATIYFSAELTFFPLKVKFSLKLKSTLVKKGHWKTLKSPLVKKWYLKSVKTQKFGSAECISMSQQVFFGFKWNLHNSFLYLCFFYWCQLSYRIYWTSLVSLFLQRISIFWRTFIMYQCSLLISTFVDSESFLLSFYELRILVKWIFHASLWRHF